MDQGACERARGKILDWLHKIHRMHMLLWFYLYSDAVAFNGSAEGCFCLKLYNA